MAEFLMAPAPAADVEALLQRWAALVRRAGLTCIPNPLDLSPTETNERYVMKALRQR